MLEAVGTISILNIPLTYFGKAAFQIQNILAACLAAFVQEVKVDDLKVGLQTFVPTAAQLPGRMNIFEFHRYRVLIDYAHNPPSLEAIGRFIAALGVQKSVAILAGTGDRRDEDLREYGRVAAEYFDEVLAWQDEDYARGRDSREVRSLIVEGARGSSKERLIQVLQNEDDAVDQALQKATANSIICIFTGRIEAMTAKIKGLQEGELDLTISKEDIPNITYADDASM